jgi:hypothetical protein
MVIYFNENEVNSGEITGFSRMGYPPYTVEYEGDGSELDFTEFVYTYKNSKLSKKPIPETDARQKAYENVQNLENWFKWYDVKFIQAMRKESLKKAFSATDNKGVKYNSVQELHEAAERKAAELSKAREQMRNL